ncbi:MAG: hypothetical protein DMG00_27700 [Acidobacteria bacterium]|nr:MAG: hypothetical protein DMG00_27700 [Acidobacteriota bacterium]
MSTYVSPADQKNVLLRTIGPPKPPPLSRQYSATFGWFCSFGIRSCSTSDSGRSTPYAEPWKSFAPAFAVMLITPPPVRPISAS